MAIDSTRLPVGQKVLLPGHFDQVVTLEGVRPLGKGFECRVRLSSGTLDETVISEDEAHVLIGDNGKETTSALELDQLRAEITTRANRLKEKGPEADSKLAALQACLKKAEFHELKDGRGKLLLFTEHRDTMTYLRDHLFCHLMVNYDLPWNPIRLTTNEWYKAQQLGDSFWLYVVWNPLQNPDSLPVMIQNPAKCLEYAAKPVVSARFWDIPASEIDIVANRAKE